MFMSHYCVNRVCSGVMPTLECLLDSFSSEGPLSHPIYRLLVGKVHALV
jgi:hypothetical protein